MKHIFKALLVCILGLPLIYATPSFAQQSSAQVFTSCSNTGVYTAGQIRLITQDINGNLCSDTAVTVTVAALSPLVVATTDKGGTITSGGVAQTAIALNNSRQGWCIQNDPAATETLYVRVKGTASATVGSALTPGAQACNVPGLIDPAAISVFAATTGHRWYGSEVQ